MAAPLHVYATTRASNTLVSPTRRLSDIRWPALLVPYFPVAFTCRPHTPADGCFFFNVAAFLEYGLVNYAMTHQVALQQKEQKGSAPPPHSNGASSTTTRSPAHPAPSGHAAPPQTVPQNTLQNTRYGEQLWAAPTSSWRAQIGGTDVEAPPSPPPLSPPLSPSLPPPSPPPSPGAPTDMEGVVLHAGLGMGSIAGAATGPATGSGIGPATASGTGPATGSGTGAAAGSGIGPAAGSDAGSMPPLRLVRQMSHHVRVPRLLMTKPPSESIAMWREMDQVCAAGVT
jgi:hypothetical protein